MEKITVYVSGEVQGVGFRYATAEAATRLGVSGWVRNLPDGRVTLEAYGETDALEALLDWCKKGPPHATVTEVKLLSRETVGSSPHTSFTISR